MAHLIPLAGQSPAVPESAWLAPTATLIGDVTLGDRASVFYGAVLRADMDRIVIGDRTNLQDNVIMHVDSGSPAIIGSGVTVGHGAILHGCTVEDGCLIGMGSIIMNRVVIGTGSLVAAGTLIMEGTVVPPRSLIAGVPGKVRRQLTDEEHAGVLKSSETYLEISAKHRAG